ncbi:MAG TPA: ImmA/IrrE family metallo-endopeptidase [Candidatus Saccharimonadales bacterium]|jgi:Zn-dependent peptidase ImmA (M78 family)|nr:ImmA/IrrE family metallo-endopeptidase [Candidatus Saccharimonadales bacterium]
MHDIQSIKQFAEEILREYNPEGLVPFPFERLAQGKGDIDLLYSGTLPEDVSGAVFLDSGRFTILINADKPNVRQYFTIAHEFGHYFLHRQWLVDNSTDGFIDYAETLDGQGMLLRADDPAATAQIDLRKEREANTFAAELLMPEKDVRDFWKLTNDIVACAKAFQVSKSAMAIRLERLHLL